MIVSICCKGDVFVECANEGTAFYVCSACEFACDTVDGNRLAMECNNDAGRHAEITQFIDQT